MKVDYLLQTGGEAYWPHLDLVASLHSAYAKRHKMEYICYRGPFPESPWFSDKVPKATWDKVWKMRSLMLDLVRDENTGWVFYVDADAIIVGDENPRPVMEDNLVGMAWYPKNKRHIGHYHCGTFFMKACDQVGDLLERIVKNGPGRHPFYSLGLLNNYLTEPQWEGKIKTLPIEWNSCVKHPADPEECIIRAWHGLGDIYKRFLAMQTEMDKRGL